MARVSKQKFVQAETKPREHADLSRLRRPREHERVAMLISTNRARPRSVSLRDANRMLTQIMANACKFKSSLC